MIYENVSPRRAAVALELAALQTQVKATHRELLLAQVELEQLARLGGLTQRVLDAALARQAELSQTLGRANRAIDWMEAELRCLDGAED